MATRPDFSQYRPCGQCRALVPRASGCGHWHPSEQVAGAVTRRRLAKNQARAKNREKIEEFRRTYAPDAVPLGPGGRPRKAATS